MFIGEKPTSIAASKTALLSMTCFGTNETDVICSYAVQGLITPGIHVHKTGLNKTLGQQSDAVISTNLIGDFNIKFGQASSYWSNQVSGSTALRRYNGISLVLQFAPLLLSIRWNR